jgi:A/G-specific adenine glycosylase
LQSPDLPSVARKIERWFARHQRPLPWRETYDPYRVWVSEVMLQQTRMEVVVPYFEKFVKRFPTLRALAAASEEDVMAAWSGLGYYRRARMLHAAAHAANGVVPRTVEKLTALPGVGRYTAGAIASIAFNQRAPIVDGNVARVLARIFGSEDDPWTRAKSLVDACKQPRDLNQGLMEIGALICTPRKPACLVCPVRNDCATRSDALPVAKPKKETRALRIALYLITDSRGRVLMRRESGPLMNAMYHLPHGDTSLLSGKPLNVVTRDLLGTFKHTVTTRRIEFALYTATARVRASKEWAWIDPAAIAEVAHPSYVAKALRVWASRPLAPTYRKSS